MLLRPAQQSDLPFLELMLYEAVFWRESDNKPSFEDALALPDVSKALKDWGKRDGDSGVVAMIDEQATLVVLSRHRQNNTFTKVHKKAKQSVC